MEWRNRIIGYGSESPDQLLANPKNFRIHPKYQQSALSGVPSEVGIVQNIIVNRTTGNVIDGHLRITLALRSGQTSIPVTYVELSESEEAEILATLDPISELAVSDKDKLEELLREIHSIDADVMTMLSDLAAKEGIIPKDQESVVLNPKYKVAVECQSEEDQKKAFEFLTQNGYVCRVLTL